MGALPCNYNSRFLSCNLTNNRSLPLPKPKYNNYGLSHKYNTTLYWDTCLDSHLDKDIGWSLLSNQSFYGQISGYEMGVGDRMVGQ